MRLSNRSWNFLSLSWRIRTWTRSHKVVWKMVVILIKFLFFMRNLPFMCTHTHAKRSYSLANLTLFSTIIFPFYAWNNRKMSNVELRRCPRKVQWQNNARKIDVFTSGGSSESGKYRRQRAFRPLINFNQRGDTTACPEELTPAWNGHGSSRTRWSCMFYYTAFPCWLSNPSPPPPSPPSYPESLRRRNHPFSPWDAVGKLIEANDAKRASETIKRRMASVMAELFRPRVIDSIRCHRLSTNWKRKERKKHPAGWLAKVGETRTIQLQCNPSLSSHLESTSRRGEKLSLDKQSHVRTYEVMKLWMMFRWWAMGQNFHRVWQVVEYRWHVFAL